MRAAIVLALGLALLSGCAHKRKSGRAPSAPPAPTHSPPVNTRPAEAARSTPAPPPPPPENASKESLYTETGVASWYGHPYHGRIAANGERYDMER